MDQRPTRDLYTPGRIKDLRSIIEGEGLVLSQFVSTPWTMSSADPKNRGSVGGTYEKLVDVGLELGAQMVNSVTVTLLNIDIPPITDRPHVQIFTMTSSRAWIWSKTGSLCRRHASMC